MDARNRRRERHALEFAHASSRASLHPVPLETHLHIFVFKQTAFLRRNSRCSKSPLMSDVEVIPIQKINEAYERMLRSDVKYRFVIDMASLGK